MSNSFYYFFSATPQVLGAILALFGVFVIFKIQGIKDELMSIGKVILSRVNYLRQQFVNKDNDIQREKTRLELDIKMSIDDRDVNELKIILDKYKGVEINQDKQYKTYKTRFKFTYQLLHSLIKETIYLSQITAFIIVLCLIIIPFGKLIECRPFILISLFVLIIGFIIYIFIKLISILKKSIKEDAFSLYEEINLDTF